MSLAVPSITYGVVLFVTPCQTVAHAAANTMVHSWHRPCSAAKKHRCCKVGHTLSILFGCALLWLLLGAVVFVLSCVMSWHLSKGKFSLGKKCSYEVLSYHAVVKIQSTSNKGIVLL
jgi:hypothetical protein